MGRVNGGCLAHLVLRHPLSETCLHELLLLLRRLGLRLRDRHRRFLGRGSRSEKQDLSSQIGMRLAGVLCLTGVMRRRELGSSMLLALFLDLC